jgi:prolyl-tRNA editing enzyme YbaK/EbsC (Cys-tRNA(Pro) deacylase)
MNFVPGRMEPGPSDAVHQQILERRMAKFAQSQQVEMSFDLPNDAAAHSFAKELARRLGQSIVVRNEQGEEVCVVHPGLQHASTKH